MLPCMKCLSSSSVGLGFSSSNAFAARIIPGVQKPHWNPPYSMKASCKGCSFPLVASPSMVKTDLPRTSNARVVHVARGRSADLNVTRPFHSGKAQALTHDIEQKLVGFYVYFLQTSVQCKRNGNGLSILVSGHRFGHEFPPIFQTG